MLQKIKKNIFNPCSHIIFLMALIFVLVITTKFEGINTYQLFIEKLAQGQVDFSIPGFHGADFLAIPIYWLTHSQVSPHILDIILVIFTIPFLYLLGNQIFKNKKMGVFLAYAYILMPLDWLDVLRGEHHAAFIFFFILGLYLIFKNSFWSWLPIGFSYIIKPYAIFAAPIFWFKKQYKEFFLSLIIPAIYLFFQISQTGQLMLGAHPDKTALTFFNLKRFVLNLIYAGQNVLSIHNYSPFSQVYFSDMSHISVVLVFLALLTVFQRQKYFSDQKLFVVLTISAVLGLIGPSFFEYLDMWRLFVFYLMVIILALPLLEKYNFFIPLSVGISGFQFFYSYLTYRSTFWPVGNKFLLMIWAIIFIISIGYYLLSISKSRETPSHFFETQNTVSRTSEIK